ncbi:aldehyde dehydrogenase family protein [Bacillus aerolatus]|uniref:Aldehyde dehydrogenase n=1 Tax=Bacillus aerolatus TaxID=2653354 RepID=A0A6I1FKR0_9BACI|nr:aldehyde dehydrogenase [Bacillus aerolatus]KAB7704219.1 aldehyde dehydrogenase family protein [Bacillus aerolatus]
MHTRQSYIEGLLQSQKLFFNTGKTKQVSFRLSQLENLKKAIQHYEQAILDALYKDLRKSEFEAYTTEVGYVLDSIKHVMKHLKKWAEPERVKTPTVHMPAKSLIVSEPYGSVLIIGPFNYPFQLVIEPLIGALAAGNCAVIKPSESTPHTSTVIKTIIEQTFESQYVQVVEGEKETTSALIHAPFDYIFFTGSTPVGKIVMEAASRRLVPVTLELGGKSPAIIDRTANLDLTAKRIVWGKFVNAGQTCVAPDYLLVHENIKEDLLQKLKETIFRFYGSDAQSSPDFGRIVNTKQFDRLNTILEKDKKKIVYGGKADKEDLFIEPAILDGADWNDASMKEEIFGPILPIMTYLELTEAIQAVAQQPKPLALYVFTETEAVEEAVLSSLSFGGGCVNDTLSHVANPYLPFGGTGNSGMNSYHGKYSFDLFSHKKGILKKSTKLELNFVFPPYGERIKWIKRLLK